MQRRVRPCVSGWDAPVPKIRAGGVWLASRERQAGRVDAALPPRFRAGPEETGRLFAASWQAVWDGDHLALFCRIRAPSLRWASHCPTNVRPLALPGSLTVPGAWGRGWSWSRSTSARWLDGRQASLRPLSLLVAQACPEHCSVPAPSAAGPRQAGPCPGHRGAGSPPRPAAVPLLLRAPPLSPPHFSCQGQLALAGRWAWE